MARPPLPLVSARRAAVKCRRPGHIPIRRAEGGPMARVTCGAFLLAAFRLCAVGLLTHRAAVGAGSPLAYAARRVRRPAALGCVVLAAVLAIFAARLPAAEGDKSEAAAKAAEAFESLYGKDWKRVKPTPDVRDDIDLAKKLLAAAKETRDQPEFLAVLCEKTAELAAVLTGYATAVEALELEAAGLPDRAPAVAARLLEIRQKQFDAAKGDDRAAAGEALLAALLPHFLEVRLFDAVVQAFSAEHAARMVAMQNAKANANDIADSFTLLYNKTRQERITSEILDLANKGKKR